MNDLERIKYIEEKLGIKLNQVSLENLFTEKYFLTELGFNLSYIQKSYFPYKGVRNYSIDEAGNVTGLGLDFCNLFLLGDNYLKSFKYLKKLKLKNTRQSDYSFLFQLENLEELDLSNNNLSDVNFLSQLKGLTLLDLSDNKLFNVTFLSQLKSLTSLYLRSNYISNLGFLMELENLNSLDLRSNNLSNANFLSQLEGLTSLYLRSNNLSNLSFLYELRKLTSLDLSDNNLSSVDFLSDLKGLTSLDLRNNKLSNLEFLSDLKDLTSLYLSYNYLSNADFLSQLKGLISLDLSDNNLSNVNFLTELKSLNSLYLRGVNLSNADFLSHLKDLISLDLSNNNLSNVNFLMELKSLNSLDLSYNYLSEPYILTKLKSLDSLSLRNTNLSSANFLTELKGLTSLDLSNNNLSNADFLSQLKDLTSLDLKNNKLSNANFLTELKNLNSLNLSDNNLSNLDSLAKLKGLVSLNLRNNNLSNVDFLSELKGLSLLDLRNNEKLKIPERVLENYWHPIRVIAATFGIEDSIYQSYIKSPEKIWELIEAKFRKPDENKALLECRVVLIGQGNAGKTSLRQRLLDLPFEDKGKTEGVEIDGKNFKVRGQDVWVNIWDFGGQEVYHTTHKFFFRERCLYILVVDVRAGMEGYIVKYWLRQIKELAKSNAPLILVANKAEDTNRVNGIDKTYKKNFDSLFDEFREIYPNIISVHYVSTNRPLNTEDVKKEVIETIDKYLPEVFTTYPPYYSQTRELFKVKKDGTSNFGNFISKEDFEKQLNDEARKDDKVVEILDILGVFCHFKQDENEQDDELGKMYVLNPEWITKGVYKILSSYILAEKTGKVEFSDIKTILNRGEYQGKHKYIIKLMKRFKLCFVKNYQDKDYVIFPTWLPIKEPAYSQFITNITRFEYKYESENELEKAITNYIVDAQSLNGNEKAYYWRRGIIVRENGLRSLVKADMKTGTLGISIEGQKDARIKKLDDIKRYFSTFHNDNEIKVREIRYEDIGKVEELIERSTLPDKHLFEEIPKLQNKLQVLNSKFQAIQPLKAGYEILEEIAELEKTNSKVEAVKAERVKTYEGFLITFLLIGAVAYLVWYLQEENFKWFKEKFGDWEHFFTLGIPPILIVTPLVWRYLYKDNALWRKIITIIENKVSKNLQKKNEAELKKYDTAQENLNSLRTKIEKAKGELEN